MANRDRYKQLERLYREYGSVHREILAENVAYTNVIGRPLAKSAVAEVVRDWVHSSRVLLYYHLGSTGSFVFVTGIHPGRIEWFAIEPRGLDQSTAPSPKR